MHIEREGYRLCPCDKRESLRIKKGGDREGRVDGFQVVGLTTKTERKEKKLSLSHHRHSHHLRKRGRATTPPLAAGARTTSALGGGAAGFLGSGGPNEGSTPLAQLCTASHASDTSVVPPEEGGHVKGRGWEGARDPPVDGGGTPRARVVRVDGGTSARLTPRPRVADCKPSSPSQPRGEARGDMAARRAARAARVSDATSTAADSNSLLKSRGTRGLSGEAVEAFSPPAVKRRGPGGDRGRLSSQASDSRQTRARAARGGACGGRGGMCRAPRGCVST